MTTSTRSNNLRHVTYSHSDYVDVLQIHADYISHKRNKTLIIDTDSIPQSIKDVYDQIICYDDSLPYASRIVNSIKQIDDEYFLLMHDNDIPLKEGVYMEKVLQTFLDKQMDCINLQHTPFRLVDDLVNIDDRYELILQHYFKNHPRMGTNYVYNVNPSIWNKNTLLEIMKEFNDTNYRDIEKEDVQKFCNRYKIYKVHCRYNADLKAVGHHSCPDFFVFFHITHDGKFVPFGGFDCYGQPYADVAGDYKEIIDKYNLHESTRSPS